MRRQKEKERRKAAGAGPGLAEAQAEFDPCTTCRIRDKGICALLLDEGRKGATPRQTHISAKAKQNIYHAGDPITHIPLICAGYAFRYVQLPDGRRQILSFILPGESIWGGAFFCETLHFSVQTITEVRYCAFDRRDLDQRIAASSAYATELAKVYAEDGIAADRSIVNLGRRSADERVAQLILDFTSRQAGGQAKPKSTGQFPLRQVHIADAVGLTQIHVSRVLNRLKAAGILTLEEGLLTIFDRAALGRIAERGLAKV